MDSDDLLTTTSGAGYEKVAVSYQAFDGDQVSPGRQDVQEDLPPDEDAAESGGGTGGSDDDNEHDSVVENEASGAGSILQSFVAANGSFPETAVRILHANLLPDDAFKICGVAILDGPVVVRLLKFVLFTLIGISVTHIAVSELVDDRDHSLKLWELFVFEGNSIIADSVIFFFVGRLYKQKGIDHLAWVGCVALCNLYFECQQYFTWLQHSVTLYEIHCVWPWQLWLFVGVMVPLVLSICYLHMKRTYECGIIVLKLSEMGMCFLFFLVPLTTSSYFHMHHWYAGWLFGMHANFDTWWSRAVMAWAWGAYINGIAVYGRDPVLTCQYAYFISVDQSCPYMKCYLHAMHEQHHETHASSPHPTIAPMIPPDWRNCSADSYHG